MRSFLIVLILCICSTAMASKADSLRKVRQMEREQKIYVKKLERASAKGDSVSMALLVAVRQSIDSASRDTVVVDESIPTLERAWRPVAVDHYIGIRGGWGFGSMRREPTRANVDLPFQLWNGGITYHFDVPSQLYVGCIEIDLGIMEKGFAYKFSSDGELATARKYTVIELPILWQPYFPFGKGGSRFYISAGPFLSYTLGGTEYTYDTSTKKMISENEYKYDPNRDYLWGYGVTVGGGFVIAIKRFAITAEFRYSIGLSDIEKGPEFIPGNPFRTPVDQMSVSLGLRYKFSVGKEKH